MATYNYNDDFDDDSLCGCFRSGFQWMGKSKAFKYGALIIHLIAFVLGLGAAGVGATSFIFLLTERDSPPLLICNLTGDLIGSSTDYSVGAFLMSYGILLLILAVNAGSIWCCFQCDCCTSYFYLATRLILVTGTSIAWFIFGIIYLQDIFPIWMEFRALCSDLIVISAVVIVAIAAIYGVIYAVVLIISVSIGCRRTCKAHHNA